MPTYHRRMAGATHITTDVTTVDCHKQVRSWRLLRALMELLIPTCNCTFMQETNQMNDSQNESRFSTVKNTINKPRNSLQFNPNPRNSHSSCSSSTTTSSSSSSSSSSLITGTIFGYRKGKVKFCIQTTLSTNPVLLLELAVSTTVLAREMRSGLLRIALECSTASTTTTTTTSCVGPSSSDLLEMPVWRMYCNGRRVGYALRRQPSKADVEVLSRMRSVVVGAGVIEGREIGCEEDDIMYLRGNFERVCGSSDAESFHLIDPDGSINQDLSIFFLRSP